MGVFVFAGSFFHVSGGHLALNRPAAVDVECLSRDVARVGRGEKNGGSHHLFRFGGAAERNHFAPDITVVGVILEVAVHVDRAGSEGVHADAKRGEFDRQLFGQSVQAGLAGAVGDEVFDAELCALRGYVDDAPGGLRLAHPTGGGEGAEKRALQVGIEDGVPLLLRRIEEARPACQPGVVDQHMELIEMLPRLGKHALDLFYLSEIGADHERASAESTDLGCGCFGTGAIGVVVDDDIGAFAGTAERERPANALTGSGDENSFCVKSHGDNLTSQSGPDDGRDVFLRRIGSGDFSRRACLVTRSAGTSGPRATILPIQHRWPRKHPRAGRASRPAAPTPFLPRCRRR